VTARRRGASGLLQSAYRGRRQRTPWLWAYGQPRRRSRRNCARLPWLTMTPFVYLPDVYWRKAGCAAQFRFPAMPHKSLAILSVAIRSANSGFWTNQPLYLSKRTVWWPYHRLRRNYDHLQPRHGLRRWDKRGSHNPGIQTSNRQQ